MTRRSSPFDDVRPAVGVAALYAVACIVWVVAGGALPGGRWLAVHLFALGVLSNLVMALTAHFAGTSHPVVQSFEPGEDWLWCYADETALEL